MGFWNFIGGFALFNAICDLFSSKPKQKYVASQQQGHDYSHEDNIEVAAYASDIDALQNEVDDLESRLDEVDETSPRYDELQDRIDTLQNRIDRMERMEEIQDEIDVLDDDVDDYELDNACYDYHDRYHRGYSGGYHEERDYWEEHEDW